MRHFRIAPRIPLLVLLVVFLPSSLFGADSDELPPSVDIKKFLRAPNGAIFLVNGRPQPLEGSPQPLPVSIIGRPSTDSFRAANGGVAEFLVAPGDLFKSVTDIFDLDQVRVKPAGQWKGIRGADHLVQWSITAGPAGATFVVPAPAGKNKRAIYQGQSPVIPMLHLQTPTAANWPANQKIVITITATDQERNALPQPSCGSLRDPVVTDTITIAQATACPQTVGLDPAQVNVPLPAGTVYNHTAGPPRNGAVGNWEGTVIYERISAPGPLFTWADIQPNFQRAWLAAGGKPNAQNIVDEMQKLRPPGSDSSFPLDSMDAFGDTHTGFIVNDASIPKVFTPAAIAAGRAGTRITQEYICGGNVIGTFTVDRVHDGQTLNVIKK